MGHLIFALENIPNLSKFPRRYVVTNCYLSIWNLTSSEVKTEVGGIEWFKGETRANLTKDFPNMQAYSSAITPRNHPYRAYSPHVSTVAMKLTTHKSSIQFQILQDGSSHSISVKNHPAGISYLTNNHGCPYGEDGRLFSICLWDDTEFRLQPNMVSAGDQDVYVLANSTVDDSVMIVARKWEDVRYGVPPQTVHLGQDTWWKFYNVNKSDSYSEYPQFGLQTYQRKKCLQYKNGKISLGDPSSADSNMEWAFFDFRSDPAEPGFESARDAAWVNVGQSKPGSEPKYSVLSVSGDDPPSPTLVTNSGMKWSIMPKGIKPTT